MLSLANSQQAEILLDSQAGPGQILTMKISDICAYRNMLFSLYFHCKGKYLISLACVSG